jgi:hypothetical protein
MNEIDEWAQLETTEDRLEYEEYEKEKAKEKETEKEKAKEKETEKAKEKEMEKEKAKEKEKDKAKEKEKDKAKEKAKEKETEKEKAKEKETEKAKEKEMEKEKTTKKPRMIVDEDYEDDAGHGEDVEVKEKFRRLSTAREALNPIASKNFSPTKASADIQDKRAAIRSAGINRAKALGKTYVDQVRTQQSFQEQVVCYFISYHYLFHR